MLWFGGIPNFELLIFGLIEMLNFEFIPDLEFLRRALIAPDAATAGGSSPRLCVDRAYPGSMLPFYRGGFCAGIHIPCVVWASATCMRNWRCDAWCVVGLKVHS